MSKESLKTKAYQIIKQKILDCEFRPGTLINETYLSELLSISRTPIRDALGRLEHERLIEIIQPKGILVATITLSEFNSYFESRLFLEPYAVSTYGHRIKKHELEIFQRFFENRTPSVAWDAVYTIISSLHNIFIEETNNPYFMQIYEQLHCQELRIQKLFPPDRDQIAASCKLYSEFLTLCLNDNWQNASKKLYQITKTYKDWIFPSFLNTYTNELRGDQNE